MINFKTFFPKINCFFVSLELITWSLWTLYIVDVTLQIRWQSWPWGPAKRLQSFSTIWAAQANSRSWSWQGRSSPSSRIEATPCSECTPATWWPRWRCRASSSACSKWRIIRTGWIFWTHRPRPRPGPPPWWPLTRATESIPAVWNRCQLWWDINLTISKRKKWGNDQCLIRMTCKLNKYNRTYCKVSFR